MKNLGKEEIEKSNIAFWQIFSYKLYTVLSRAVGGYENPGVGQVVM